MSGLLKEYRDKIANAMQMMKAMEIREKKRMADALEEKAKAEKEDRPVDKLLFPGQPPSGLGYAHLDDH